MLKTMACISMALTSACAMQQDPPVLTRLPVPTVRMHGEAQIASEGLDVTVTPIAADNMQRFPQIWKALSFQRAVPDGQGGVAMRPGTISLAIVPLPSFQVRIVNKTDHVIRLSTAIFRLESNVGKRWQTFASSDELAAWNMGVVAASGLDPQIQSQLVGQFTGLVGSLQLLTRSVELLKGDEWSGYLVFNLGTTKPSDYMDLMASMERFTLRLAEVPVETTDSGAVTKTTEFTFVLDKATTEIAAVCPPKTTQASWENGCVPKR